jgi:DnaJ-class molecular chaperone
MCTLDDTGECFPELCDHKKTVDCDMCNGTGEGKTEHQTCKFCHGKGEIIIDCEGNNE